MCHFVRSFLYFFTLALHCCEARLDFKFSSSHNMQNVVSLTSSVLNWSVSNTVHIVSSMRTDLHDEFLSLYTNYSVVLYSPSNLQKSTTDQKLYCRAQPKEVFSVVVAFHLNEEQLTSLMFNEASLSSTVFIIVCKTPVQRAKSIVSEAWKRKYIFRVVLFGSSQSSIAVMFDPFLDCTNGSFTRISAADYASVATELNKQIKYLNLCPLRISMYAREQTAVFLGNQTFTGQDGHLISLLAESMNFTPHIYLDKNKRMTYGYRVVNGTVIGTFARLLDGSADICLNGHFMKGYNCECVELTRHITSDRVCLLTPKAGVVPPIITVLKSFQLQVWAMVVVTYLTTVVFYYFANHMLNSTYDDCALEIFRIFVALPLSRRINYNWQAVLFAVCWFFSIVILNSFQGSLVTFLNTPMHFPDIDTFEDLIESQLPIRTSSSTFRELLLGDPNLSNLVKKLFYSETDETVYNFDGRFAGFQRINVYNLKYFQDIIYVLNERESRVLHTMKQCLMSYFISYAIPKSSPYKKRIDQIISRVERSGLLIKWNSDSAKYIFTKYHLVTRGDDKAVRVFSLVDLEVAFFALAFGLLSSCLVFVCEIYMGMKRQQSLKPTPGNRGFDAFSHYRNQSKSKHFISTNNRLKNTFKFNQNLVVSRNKNK